VHPGWAVQKLRRPAVLAGVVLTVGAASLVVPVGTAGAITTPSYGLEPVSLPNSTTPRSEFTYALRPGQSLTDEVALSNFTDQPLSFFLYGADGYNTAVGGGFALRQRGHHNVEVGAWISVITSTYTVLPHTAVAFPFAVRVPLNASPGDHVGGLVALQVAVTPANKGKSAFEIRQGIAVAVYVRVSGPLHPGVAITRVGAHTSEPALAFAESNSRASVFFTIQNVGNVDLNATATAKVTDIFGRTVKTFPPAKLTVITPGAIFTVIEPAWKPLPIAGPQHIVVRFVTDKAGTVSAGDLLWIIPWIMIAALAAIILGIVLWWRIRRRRRLRPDSAPEPEPAVEEVGAAP
jgi:hypothetical protein